MSSRVSKRGEAIRLFILNNVEEHPEDISKVTAKHFDISRQAVNKHLQKLGSQQALAESGNTRSRRYALRPIREWKKAYASPSALEEHVVWRNDVREVIGQLPSNVVGIWYYGFSEMLNNAIDHSEASRVQVFVKKTAVTTEVMIFDNGVGIFKKIETALGLSDERHAVLELSKGKLTTDPKHHTGQGIFFSSRMFDYFAILSGDVYFSHEFGKKEDWISQSKSMGTGTAVFMELNNHTARTTKKVFDQFTSGEDYGFNKTVVPVSLAQYEGDELISRSQAKRVLARVELFKVVLFDFTNVDHIGQAFADEIFRVFAQSHPKIELYPINANSATKQMIERARLSDPGGTEDT